MKSIDKNVYAAFKEHCKNNGLMIGFTLTKVIKDYLYDNDPDWDREELNRIRIEQLLNQRKQRES